MKLRKCGLTLRDKCLASAVKLWRKLCDWTLILIDVCLAGAVAVLLSWGAIKLLIHIDPSFVLKDLAFVVPAIIILVGWYTTAKLNHKNEIAKRRLDCRLKMLNDFMPIASTLFKYATNPNYKGKDPFKEDKDLMEKLEKTQVDFFVYGYRAEIKMMENFIEDLKKVTNTLKYKEAQDKIVPRVRDKIRKELEIEAIKVTHPPKDKLKKSI